MEEHKLKKTLFTEQFFIKGKIDSVSHVNTRSIKNHILSNFMKANRYEDSQYWYMSEYFKVPYHQHIQWTQDWLRDHYMIDFDYSLVPTPKDSIRGIIQQTGEQVNTHHNIKDWNLQDSPDLSCLYTVGTGPKYSQIIFEYDDGRYKHRRWKCDLEPDTFILFSSHIPFSITKNENKDFLVNLSLQFQLI